MSTPISQKSAVINAVVSVLGSSFTIGETNVKSELSSEQLEEVRGIVLDGILSGTVLFNKDMSDSKFVRRYVNGMIDNHFRKAKELNGGNRYLPTSSGKSRRDPQLSALKKLIKNYTENSDEFIRVTSAIENREQQLAESRKLSYSSKKKSSILESIDTSGLPEDLQEVLAQGN